MDPEEIERRIEQIALMTAETIAANLKVEGDNYKATLVAAYSATLSGITTAGMILTQHDGSEQITPQALSKAADAVAKRIGFDATVYSID